MTENHENDLNRQASENNQLNEDAKTDRDIIELSDIAIGITPEDDAIVELTEEIIGEAFFGFNKATHETMDEDESHLDLSEDRQSDGITEQQPDRYKGAPESPDVSRTMSSETDGNEDDISRELDNYFGTEDDIRVKEVPAAVHPIVDETGDPSVPLPSTGPSELPAHREIRQIGEIAITSDQLDEAIERVIRKLYAEKINRILDAMIERTVTEEISQLKDYLIGIAEKKD
ncbi:MAG: hypothetical protein C4518_14120 [Desulfobacteraceae bacterium]|nr:MAG: hypothetical protein C4518_14120 [Desulfobacteraceae bacterium]